VRQPDPSWTKPVPNARTYEDARANLEHTLQVFADSENDRLILMTTSNIYGPGVRTGLTMGDLRLIAQMIGADKP
jgi:hypothetical protein